MSEVNGTMPYADAWHYPVVLRRHWWVVVTGAAIGLLAALAYLLAGNISYSATAAVDVNAISSEPFNATRPSSGLLDAQTEQQLAQSSTVVVAVSDALGGSPRPSEVRNHLRAKLPAGGTVMQIDFTAASADDARLGVAAAADNYLSYRSELAQNRQNAVIENLRTQQKSLRAQLAAANAAIFSTKPQSTARTQAVSDRQSVTIALGTLSSQLNSIASIDTSGGTVLTSSGTTSVSSSPSPVNLLVTGLLVGLVLGLVAAFVLDRWGRRVKDDRDVARAGAGSLLVSLSERSGSVPPTGSDVDQVRVLRERTLAMLNGSGGVVALLDRTHGPNPSDVPVNLALSLLEGGYSVSLVLDGYDSLLEHVLVGGLDLVRLSPVDQGGDVAFDSRAYDGLQVRQLSGSSQVIAGGQNWQDEPGRPDHVRVIAVGNAVSRGAQLTGARSADVVLLVADDHLSRSKLTHASAELAAVGAVVGGVVLVSSKRRLATSTDEGDGTGEVDANGEVVSPRREVGAK